MKNGIVYCYENLENGKKYVGITTLENSKERWASHERGKSGCKVFNLAMLKYGKQSFVRYILEDEVPIESLPLLERYWIKELNTYKGQGYNQTSGGEIGKEFTHTEEAKRKISEAGKRQIFTTERRKKISDALLGKKKSETHVAKMRGLKRKPISEEDREKLISASNSKIAIRCVETQETFVSIREATRTYGGLVCNYIVALKNRSVCRGFHWMRQIDYESGVEFIPAEVDRTNRNVKRVRCVETGEVFSSVKEATLAKTGKEDGNISRALRHNTMFAGLHWEYIM
jgi:group I intron endonuclease